MKKRFRVAPQLCALFFAGVICSVASADADDQYREATHRGGECSVGAMMAVEAANARDHFEDFEREMMIQGAFTTFIPNFVELEERMARVIFSRSSAAHVSRFKMLARNRLREGQPVNGHEILTEMRKDFPEMPHHGRLYPKLKDVGIDPKLQWSMSNGLFRQGTDYLLVPGTSGFNTRRGERAYYLAARVEQELYLFIYHPDDEFIARRGRLGVFEVEPPHRPIGTPEHIGVLWDYLESQGVSLIPSAIDRS